MRKKHSEIDPALPSDPNLSQNATNRMRLYHDDKQFSADEIDIRIIFLINQKKQLKQIIDSIPRHRSNIYRRIKRLLKSKIIANIGTKSPKLFEVTSRGENVLNSTSRTSRKILRGAKAERKPQDDCETPSIAEDFPPVNDVSQRIFIRSHSLKWRIPISQVSKRFWLKLKCDSWIDFHFHDMGPRNQKTWRKYYGRRLFFDKEVYLEFTPRNIFVVLPHIYAPDPQTAYATGLSFLGNVIEQLQDIYPKVLFGDSEFICASESQHHAIVNDPRAIYCRKNGISLSSPDFEIDSSKGKPELETKGKNSKDNCLTLWDSILFQGETGIGLRDVFKGVQALVEVQNQSLELIKTNTDLSTQGGMTVRQINQQFASLSSIQETILETQGTLMKAIQTIVDQTNIDQKPKTIDQTLQNIQSNEKLLIRQITQKKKEKTLSEIRTGKVLRILMDSKGPMKRSEIIRKSSMKTNTLRWILYLLKRDGRIKKTKRGWELL